MQELSAMNVQLATSLESMTHTKRIIYCTVDGHEFIYRHDRTLQSVCFVFECPDFPHSSYRTRKRLKRKKNYHFLQEEPKPQKSFPSSRALFASGKDAPAPRRYWWRQTALCWTLKTQEENHRHVMKEILSSII